MNDNKISFRLKSEVRIGLGVLKHFKDEASALNIVNPLILCDHNLLDTEYFKTIKFEFQSFGDNSTFFPIKLSGEPTYELLADLIKELDLKSYDGIVSIGGGSIMDIGKGLALLATNPCEPKQLKGFPLGLKCPLQHITVPSILGSGSEASFNAVFIDEAEGKKLGINSINNFPTLVLSDPLLSMSAPDSVVISSVLDCMVHCVDSFGSLRASPISKMFSMEAFRNVWTFLSDKDVSDSESRLLLARASILGIYGLMNSGDGPTNGFAYYFGVKEKIPHGMAGGMFLKDIMRWNFENGFDAYKNLIKDTSSKDMKHFFAAFSKILKKYSVPRLPDYGYSMSDRDDLAVEASAALAGSFAGNPILFDNDSASWVLKQQFRG
ncbi:iron-containing alcohol dehydrogenase [Paracoccaceae bacterium]|nr:iron-containing alcohol dehydrogenase [Paracoccaceae bacterium]